MKRIIKIIKLNFILVILMLLSFFSYRLVKAEEELKTSSDIILLGSQIRLDESHCIRFAIDFSNYHSDEIDKYGMVIGLGFTTGYVDDGYTRSNIFDDVGVARSEVEEIHEVNEGIFYLNVWNVPYSEFDTTFVVVGYVVLKDGSKVYSEKYMKRNLTDTARMAYSEHIDGPIIRQAVKNKLVKVVNSTERKYYNDIPTTISASSKIDLAIGTYSTNLNITGDKIEIKGLNKFETIINSTLNIESNEAIISNLTFQKSSNIIIKNASLLNINNCIFNQINDTNLKLNNNLKANAKVMITDNIFNATTTNDMISISTTNSLDTLKISGNRFSHINKGITINIPNEVTFDHNVFIIEEGAGNYIVKNNGTKTIHLDKSIAINHADNNAISEYNISSWYQGLCDYTNSFKTIFEVEEDYKA